MLLELIAVSITISLVYRQEEERRRREEEMLRKREMEEQMRRQGEDNYRMGNFMDVSVIEHSCRTRDEKFAD